MADPTHQKPLPTRVMRVFTNQVPRKALRDLTNRIRFGTQGPLTDEALYFDPAKINLRFVPKPPLRKIDFRRKNSGEVRSGDWDLSAEPMDHDIKFLSCKAHFIDGTPWEDTPIFAKSLIDIAAGIVVDGCASKDALTKRYQRLDAFWEVLKREGEFRLKGQLPDQFRREHGGVFVHINRHGQAMRSGGGMHRFSIARLAGLPFIPVQVGVVHSDVVTSGNYAKLRHKPV